MTKTPMMIDDAANVSRMRYSTESFIAGSETSTPATNANTMPSSTEGTNDHPWMVIM